MKKIFNFMLVLGGMLVLAASCNKILEEHPKTIFTPGYFSTPAGVEGGLTALYSHLRDVYGDPYTWSDLEAATDETTFSNSGFRGNDFSTGAHVTADNCPKSGFWNFTYINTANGIIENATAAGMAESLIAEARFFRAFYYFDLVRIFGGVPLDLGSGELAFNTSAVRVSTRNTVEEVYKKCIFPDLEYALENIPDKPRIGGALSKTAVRILLSRAYLTYAWWLENPKGLPTYPECTRNAGDARTYFQKAYDLAVQGIENPGPYGLESSFYKVSLGSNDYNKEQVFYSDRTEKSEQYNGAPVTGWDQGTNFVCWFHQWNYSAATVNDNTGKATTPIQRTDSQFLGRPWTRLAPTHEALHTFTDIDKDSRFDGTFTWIFRTNWDQFGAATEWVVGPHGNHIGVKEPLLVFLPYVDESVTYPTDLTGNLVSQGFGAKEGVDSYVIDLRGINRFTYPGLWKQGPYRTNTGSPVGAGEANVGSTRPYIIYKFSELYFIAAEAQVKGASAKAGKSAYDLINVIRSRAGKWEFKNNEQQKYSADFSAELTAKTPNPVTIDFLLDEMLREYYGEGKRWFDLARTQQWLERALNYTITETTTSHTPVTLTRDIIELNYMNPIPQGQINAMQMSEEEKKAYQTPGYWLE
jgi:hypothetical protein